MNPPGQSGRLRPLAASDVELTFAWRNQRRVREAMFSPRELERSEHQAWVERVIADVDRDYQIYELDGVPLGVAGIIFHDRAAGTAEWSFHIGSSEAPRGSGAAMLKLMLARFFGPHRGECMFAEVLEDNIASLSLHRKLGFVETDEPRRTVTHDGRLKDVVKFQLTSTDWLRGSHLGDASAI